MITKQAIENRIEELKKLHAALVEQAQRTAGRIDELVKLHHDCAAQDMAAVPDTVQQNIAELKAQAPKNKKKAKA